MFIVTIWLALLHVTHIGGTMARYSQEVVQFITKPNILVITSSLTDSVSACAVTLSTLVRVEYARHFTHRFTCGSYGLRKFDSASILRGLHSAGSGQLKAKPSERVPMCMELNTFPA